MNIAEKLTQIAEDQKNVYDAGHSKGYNTGYSEGNEAGHANGFSAGVAEHFRSYYRRCNATKNFLYAFAGGGWNNNVGVYDVATYIPTEDVTFKCDTNSASMYAYSNVTDTVAAIDLSKATNNVSSTFANATKLVTIRKLIVSETTPTIGFTGCAKLENLTVEGTFGKAVNLSPCKVLSNASVQNVIDCLKDLTGETSLKLTLHADVGAAVTDEQKAAISAKNWTLAY